MNIASSIPIKEISVKEYQDILDKCAQHVLLDVRERWESNIAKITNSKLIPLNFLENHLDELDKESQIVVYCHHGVRSYHACQLLKRFGFDNVFNLKGGIHMWSKEIDETIPIY